MYIVDDSHPHKPRYIYIPSRDRSWYRYSDCASRCKQLLCYTADPALYMKHATSADHYILIQQMLDHKCVDMGFIDRLRRCMIPELPGLVESVLSKDTITKGGSVNGFISLSSSAIANPANDILIDSVRLIKWARHQLWFSGMGGTYLYTVVQVLSIAKSAVTDADIRPFSNLKTLDISGTKNITLEFINQCHPLIDTLEDLSMSSTTIKDAGICNLRVLRRLNTSENPKITLSFLNDRHPLTKSLEELHLNNTIVTDDAMKYLKCLKILVFDLGSEVKLSFLDSTHPMNDTLIELKIGETVSDKNLQHLRVLRKLSIYYGSVTLSFLTPTSPLATSLKELHLSTSKVTDRALQHLQSLQMLKTTSMEHISLSFLSREHGSPLAHTLTHLDLHMSGVTDESLKHLHSLQRLHAFMGKFSLSFITPDHPLAETLVDIDVSSCDIGDDGLKNLHNLQKLKIVQHPNLTLSFITQNHPLTGTLEELNIRGDYANSAANLVTDRSLRNLRALTRLKLTDNRAITLSFLGPDHPLVYTLETLDLWHTGVTGEALSHLRVLRKLKEVANNSLSFSFITPDHPIVNTLVDLDSMSITDEYLQHLHNLKSIKLSYNNATLSFMTPTHPFVYTLTSLAITGSGNMDEGIKHLRMLRTLEIPGNKETTLSFLTPNHPLVGSLTRLRCEPGSSRHKKQSMISDETISMLVNLHTYNGIGHWGNDFMTPKTTE